MKKPTVIGFIPKKTIKKNDKTVESEKKENNEKQKGSDKVWTKHL